jgi:phosphoglycolate phosphatase
MTGILWDLDGTLLDTLGDLTDAANYALRSHGYPERTMEEMRTFIGSGARLLIQRATPAGGDADSVQRLFHSYYESHCRIKTKPYDGIVEALAELGKKYPIAIVSNKPDSAVKALCDEIFPGIYARGESSDCPRKPAPDMVFKAMETIGVQRCIYVGDSDVDVITAKNTGGPCLSVLWGFRNEAEIRKNGGEYFCHDPKDLAQTLKNMVKEIYGQ